MNDDDPRKTRKERVLHTRVPEVLDQELKRLAESLRVPVSNVVRTILEDALDAMELAGEVAEDQLRGVAERLHQQRVKLVGRDTVVATPAVATVAEPPLAGIVGFQPLLLARDTACVVCGAKLSAGSEAFLGLRDTPTDHRVVVGPECLPFGAGKTQETT